MTTVEEQVEEQKKEEEVEEESPEKQLADITPIAEHRKQVVGLGEDAVTYVQAPLSFIGKMRLSSILGRALRRAMESGGGPALASLFGSSEEELTEAVVTGRKPLTKEELDETALFMQAIGVLMEFVPDIMLDVYVVALNVPDGEQEWAKETMSLRAEEGGLSDADGVEILETFVNQNWEALKSFFAEQIQPLLQKIRDARSPQQRPSRATRRATQRRSKSSSRGRGGASK